MIDNDKYMLFNISFHFGCDICSFIFVQKNGNEENINKFIKINNENIKNKSIRISDDTYTRDELDIIQKRKFSRLFHHGAADNDDIVILKGKLEIPGKNKSLKKDDLEKWWEENFGDPKWPKWENISEDVTIF